MSEPHLVPASCEHVVALRCTPADLECVKLLAEAAAAGRRSPSPFWAMTIDAVRVEFHLDRDRAICERSPRPRPAQEAMPANP